MNGNCRKQKAESQKLTAGHVREKEDGNPYQSAFYTEQEPASLASKKKWLTLCVHAVSKITLSMGGMKTCGTAPTTTVVFSLRPKNDEFCVI